MSLKLIRKYTEFCNFWWFCLFELLTYNVIVSFQFKEIAPSGLIAMKKFYTIMLELPSSTVSINNQQGIMGNSNINKVKKLGELYRVISESFDFVTHLAHLAYFTSLFHLYIP